MLITNIASYLPSLVDYSMQVIASHKINNLFMIILNRISSLIPDSAISFPEYNIFSRNERQNQTGEEVRSYKCYKIRTIFGFCSNFKMYATTFSFSSVMY